MVGSAVGSAVDTAVGAVQTVPPAGVTDLPLGTKPSDPTNRSLDAARVPLAQHPLALSKHRPSPRPPLAPANAAGASDQTRPADNASSTDHLTGACSVASHGSNAEAPPRAPPASPWIAARINPLTYQTHPPRRERHPRPKL